MVLKDFYKVLNLDWFAEEKETEEGKDNEGADDEVDKVDDKEVDSIVKENEIDGLSEEETKQLLRKALKSNQKLANIARTRLHEIMERKKKLKTIEDEAEKKQLDELKEKEKYKEMLEAIQPKYDILKDDVLKTHTYLEEELETEVAGLDEKYQGLVPEGDIRNKLSWIHKFKQTVDNNKPAKKQTVGEGGPEIKDKKDVTEHLEKQINDCSTPEELEELLNSMAGK